MKLSQAVARLPAGSAGIRLVNAGICEIDTLPQHYQGVRVLLLSQNKISTLAGLVYFQQLEKLSLSQNMLDSFDELTYLQALYNLKQLRLDGNPVAYHPSYKCRALDAVPSIVELDGVPVTQNDRLQAYALLTQMLYKEQLILEDIYQILQFRQQNADPERILYEKVQKYRIQRSRQATWQTIYDAVAMYVQNELAGLLTNFELSYRQSYVFGIQSGKVDQDSLNGKNSTPRKRISSSQLTEMTKKYASSPEATVKSIVHQTALSGQNQLFENQDYLLENYRQTFQDGENMISYQNAEMQRMRYQMDVLRAQLLEYQKANAENIELSVNQIHELKRENEQLYTIVNSLYHANEAYYQSVVEKYRYVDSTEGKTAALQRDLQQTAAALYSTQLKQKALESDCKNLAREVLKHYRGERAIQALQKAFKRRYFAYFCSNCRVERKLSEIEAYLSTTMRRKASVYCMRLMRKLTHYKALFLEFKRTSERRKLSAGLTVWRKANKTAGFKLNELKTIDSQVGTAVHVGLYLKRPFACWVGLLKQNQFKAKLLGQKCAQFYRAMRYKEVRRLLRALSQRARLTGRNVLIIEKNVQKTRKQAAMGLLIRAFAARRRAAQIGANLDYLYTQQRQFAAFKVWRALSFEIRAEQRVARKSECHTARNAFQALRAQFALRERRKIMLAVADFAFRTASRANSIITQKAAFLALRTRKFALAGAERLISERVYREICWKISGKGINFAALGIISPRELQRCALAALRGELVRRQRAGAKESAYGLCEGSAYIRFYGLSQEQGQSFDQSLTEFFTPGASKELIQLRRQAAVYKQEVQKFYALALYAQNDAKQAKNGLAAAQIENQRLGKLAERLNIYVQSARASALNYTYESSIAAENERLQVENAQLRACASEMGRDLSDLRAALGGGLYADPYAGSFEAVLSKLRNAQQDLSEYRRLFNSLQLLLMQRTAECDAAKAGLLAAQGVGGCENDSLRANFEQAKSLNNELQERLRMSEMERRELLARFGINIYNPDDCTVNPVFYAPGGAGSNGHNECVAGSGSAGNVGNICINGCIGDFGGLGGPGSARGAGNAENRYFGAAGRTNGSSAAYLADQMVQQFL